MKIFLITACYLTLFLIPIFAEEASLQIDAKVPKITSLRIQEISSSFSIDPQKNPSGPFFYSPPIFSVYLTYNGMNSCRVTITSIPVSPLGSFSMTSLIDPSKTLSGLFYNLDTMEPIGADGILFKYNLDQSTPLFNQEFRLGMMYRSSDLERACGNLYTCAITVTLTEGS
ncbi:MAG: hypothetical protein WCN87_03155 [Chlamydiota bacterium]